MEKTTADRIEEVLSLAYGKRFHPGLVTVMEQRFSQEPDEAVEAAVSTCIGQCEFPPTIAEITRQIAAHRITAAKDRLQEKYQNQAPEAVNRVGVKKTFITADWKQMWADARKRSDDCFQQARKHFRLDFLHPIINVRRRHSDIGVMIRKALIARGGEEYTAAEIIASVTATLKEGQEKEA